MDYLLKSGVLTDKPSGQVLARLKQPALGEERLILSPDGKPLLRASVKSRDDRRLSPNDVRQREYLLLDGNGGLYASAKPGYATRENPDTAGWPVCRAPKVDHAEVRGRAGAYLLNMADSGHYEVRGGTGPLLQIEHLGILGGWRFSAAAPLPPQFLLGLFLFCRFLERENEFAAV